MNYIKLTDYEAVLLKQALLKAEVSTLATPAEAANIRDLHVTIDQQIEENAGCKLIKVSKGTERYFVPSRDPLLTALKNAADLLAELKMNQAIKEDVRKDCSTTLSACLSVIQKAEVHESH